MIKIYHNNKCSKSRAALKKLQDGNVDFEVIEYLKQTPTADELEEIIKSSDYSTIDFVRTKEKLFVDEYKNKNLSDSELIKILVKYPELIQRPIIISGKKVIIARDEDCALF